MGSMLPTVLFINDLLDGIHLFANDVQIYNSFLVILVVSRVSSDLCRIVQWTEEIILLIINSTLSKSILFGKRSLVHCSLMCHRIVVNSIVMPNSIIIFNLSLTISITIFLRQIMYLKFLRVLKNKTPLVKFTCIFSLYKHIGESHRKSHHLLLTEPLGHVARELSNILCQR